VISDWKDDYNQRRRHSSLGDQASAVYAAACTHRWTTLANRGSVLGVRPLVLKESSLDRAPHRLVRSIPVCLTVVALGLAGCTSAGSDESATPPVQRATVTHSHSRAVPITHATIGDIDGAQVPYFSCENLPADDAVFQAGHEPNGVFWEGVARYLAPAIFERLDSDPGAGMFSVSGSLSNLEALQRLLEPIMNLRGVWDRRAGCVPARSSAT
jgi:hypothetical protein